MVSSLILPKHSPPSACVGLRAPASAPASAPESAPASTLGGTQRLRRRAAKALLFDGASSSKSLPSSQCRPRRHHPCRGTCAQQAWREALAACRLAPSASLRADVRVLSRCKRGFGVSPLTVSRLAVPRRRRYHKSQGWMLAFLIFPRWPLWPARLLGAVGGFFSLPCQLPVGTAVPNCTA